MCLCCQLRAFWSFVFIVGMGLSVALSLGMFRKFNSSKLLTTIESTHEPLSHFEFPSVTVCSQNRFSKSKLKRIREENWQLQALTEDDLIFAMKIMIKPDSDLDRKSEVKAIHDTLDANGVKIEQLINISRHVSFNNESPTSGMKSLV